MTLCTPEQAETAIDNLRHVPHTTVQMLVEAWDCGDMKQYKMLSSILQDLSKAVRCHYS